MISTFEAGKRYAQGFYDLFRRYNVLFVADETRMNVCRTGRFLSSEYLRYVCKPDMVILGKSVIGGMYLASYILGNEDVMSIVGKREIVQTFAFSPLVSAATTAILEVVDKDKLTERAVKLKTLFSERARRYMWEELFSVNFSTARGAEMATWFKDVC